MIWSWPDWSPPALGEEEDLNVEVLFNDRLFVVADRPIDGRADARSILQNSSTSLGCLQDLKRGLTRIWRTRFARRGLDMPKAALVTQSVPVRVHLLANGRYITTFGHSPLRLYDNLKALPVDLPDRPWPVVIATLKNRTLSPVVERFIECAREVAKGMGALLGGGQTMRPRKQS